MSFFRRLSFTQWIIVAAIAGVVLGVVAPDAAKAVDPLSTVFLRLIKSLVVPLIFSTLVVGIAGHGGDSKRVGRLAVRSLVYFEVVTTAALAIGLFAVNLIRPGDGIRLSGASTEAGARLAATKVTFGSIIEHAIPQSIFESATHNDVLQVVVWSVIFGFALSALNTEHRERILGFCVSLAELMFKFTAIVMLYAPIGIGAALAATVATNGLHVLVSLGTLVLTLYGALIAFALLVLLPIALIAKLPVSRFVRTVREPALIAFSTASSEAALPSAMRAMERFGVPPRIVAFVMPTGYSFNLDGTTLYLALASVFAAQAGGIEMPITHQIIMMVTLMLTSKGVAGVSRASLVILSGTLTMFGLPLEAIAVILGVDAFMDMARTMINVIGNCLATAVMARWEGELIPAPAAPYTAMEAAS